MSASLRFLALAVVGWAGMRAATLGALPGTEAFTLGRNEPVRVAATADVPAIVPTEFPAIEPVAAEMSPLEAQLAMGGATAAAIRRPASGGPDLLLSGEQPRGSTLCTGFAPRSPARPADRDRP